MARKRPARMSCFNWILVLTIIQLIAADVTTVFKVLFKSRHGGGELVRVAHGQKDGVLHPVDD